MEPDSGVEAWARLLRDPEAHVLAASADGVSVWLGSGELVSVNGGWREL